MQEEPADAVQKELLIADHEGLWGWSDKFSRGGPKKPVDADQEGLWNGLTRSRNANQKGLQMKTKKARKVDQKDL